MPRLRIVLLALLVLLVVAALVTANVWPAVAAAVVLLALLSPARELVPVKWLGGNRGSYDPKEHERLAPIREPASDAETRAAWESERERRGL